MYGMNDVESRVASRWRYVGLCGARNGGYGKERSDHGDGTWFEGTWKDGMSEIRG